MKPSTNQAWTEQNRHDGDRWRLFRAIEPHIGATAVLYPGSYVDIAPSFVFPSVTYVESDSRAPVFFGDVEGVREIIASHPGSPPDPEVEFIHSDYMLDLDLPEQSFDLLVSLYAGFVSEHCTRYLRMGGTLLVNPRHGDVAMASIDRRYQLKGVVESRSGSYRVEKTMLTCTWSRRYPSRSHALCFTAEAQVSATPSRHSPTCLSERAEAELGGHGLRIGRASLVSVRQCFPPRRRQRDNHCCRIHIYARGRGSSRSRHLRSQIERGSPRGGPLEQGRQ